MHGRAAPFLAFVRSPLLVRMVEGEQARPNLGRRVEQLAIGMYADGTEQQGRREQ